jgi:hypothetical protein
MPDFLQSLRHYTARGFQAAKDTLESRQWPARPQSLNFEITSICDSKCIHCPRHEMDRTMRPMPFELFKKMIDEAAELEIPDLCPNGYGEIMTMRNLEPYLEYISSKSHKFRITINTNAYRMTEEKIELLIKHKVALLNICIDGATAPTAEGIRVGLELAQIEANIHRLMAIRKERKLGFPKIRVGYVKIPQNMHEIPMFIDKWKGKVDYIGLDGYSNRAGSLTGKFEDEKVEERTGVCVLPFKELNIWADGKAVLCCNDWNEEHLVGDLNQESIASIWRGKAMTTARELHKSGKGGELKICAGCNYWKDPSLGSRLWV